MATAHTANSPPIPSSTNWPTGVPKGSRNERFSTNSPPANNTNTVTTTRALV